MKRNHSLYLRVTDEANDLIEQKAGKAVPKAIIAAAILEAATDALREAKRFTLPIRFKVLEEEQTQRGASAH